MKKVFMSIVYYNSLTVHGDKILKKSLDSLTTYQNFEVGKNLYIRLCDNGSTDETFEFIKNNLPSKDIILERNSDNLGFSGAHNQSVKQFLESSSDYLFLHNPDLRIYEDCLEELVNAIEKDDKIGLACAKLYRGDGNLNLTEPVLLDSAGMYLHCSLRHFDRGSNCEESDKFSTDEYVFGGTGACLLLKRSLVEATQLPEEQFDSPLFRIYPQLEQNREQRVQLFDEAFFAYREDADLAWRAKNLDWKCIYAAGAKGIHKRIVLPDNRKDLNPIINYLGVRNRFLLQLNNYKLLRDWKYLIPGIVFRNLLVVMVVLLYERTSFKALHDVYLLLGRALNNRQ